MRRVFLFAILIFLSVSTYGAIPDPSFHGAIMLNTSAFEDSAASVVSSGEWIIATHRCVDIDPLMCMVSTGISPSNYLMWNTTERGITTVGAIGLYAGHLYVSANSSSGMYFYKYTLQGHNISQRKLAGTSIEAYRDLYTYATDALYATGNIGSDGYVIKLNSTLHTIWNRTLTQAFFLEGITASSNGVFLSGHNRLGPTSIAVLYKLSHNGISQWNTTFNFSNITNVRITHDAASNLYILGTNGTAFLLASFTKEGNHLWNSTLSFPSSNVHRSHDLSFDKWGKITVSGTVNNSNSADLDIFTAILSSNGTMEWNATYESGAAAVHDVNDEVSDFSGLAIDARNNLLVGGMTSPAMGNSPVGRVVRYVRPYIDPVNCNVESSTVDWSVSAFKSALYTQACTIQNSYINNSVINSTSVINSVVLNVTSLNSLILDSDLFDAHVEHSVVSSTNFSCEGLTLIGATVSGGSLTTGKIKYRNIYFSAPMNVDLICSGAIPFTHLLTASPQTIAHEMEIILNAYAPIPLKSVQFEILSLNGTFNLTEENAISSSQGFTSGRSGSLYVDSQGNVLGTGSGTTAGGTKTTVLRLNSTLSQTWKYDIPSQDVPSAIADELETSQKYAIFTALQHNGTNEDVGIITFPYASNTSTILNYWKVTSPENLVRGAVLSEEQLLLTSVNDTTGSWQMLFFDTAGNVLRNYSFVNGTGSLITDVVVDRQRQDRIFVGGGFGAVGSQRPFIARYDTSGTLIWTKYLSQMGGVHTHFTDLEIDFEGNIIAVGKNSSDQDLLLQKWSPDGVLLWNTTYGFSYAGGGGKDAAVDKQSGVIYVLTHKPAGNPFVEKFAANGSYVKGADLNVGSYPFAANSAFGIAVDSEGKLLVLGFSGGNIVITKYRVSTIINALDSGISPDMTKDDGLWTTSFYSRDSERLVNITGKLQDNSGNNYPATLAITVDTTLPNASLIINANETTTALRSVVLSSLYADKYGISGCRYSNYNLSSLKFLLQFEKTAVADHLSPVGNLPINGINNFNYTAGVSGSAISLQGLANRNLSYNITANMSKGTMEFWVSPQWSATGENLLLSTSNGALLGNTSQGITIYRNGSNLVSVWTNTTRGDETLLYSNISSWGANSWHHVAVVWDFTALKEVYMYLDGVLVASNTSVTRYPFVQGNYLHVGAGFGAGGLTAANASLDQIAVYSSTMTAQEITQSYQTPSRYAFGTCAQSSSWQLSSDPGDKTVWLQVKDAAGNINTVYDEITLLATGDQTPPLALEVIDDGNYTNSNSSLHARFESFDPESAIFFEVRLHNETTNVTQWIQTAGYGSDDEYTFYGLNLRNNGTYYIEARASNYNNYSITARSDGITVDTIPPSQLTLLSGTNSQLWVSNISVSFVMNGTDSISGIRGLSYTLSTSHQTPDAILETMNMTYPIPHPMYRWNATFNGSSGNVWERINDIAVNRTDLYVIGYNATNAGSELCLVLRYNTTGSQIWNITSGVGSARTNCKTGKLNSTGGLIIAGEYLANSIPQTYLQALHPEGTTAWQKNISLGNGSSPRDVELGSDDAIYFVGYTLSQTMPTTSYGFVAKASSQGNLLWNYTSNIENSTFYALEIDAAGKIYVNGLNISTDLSSYDAVQLALHPWGALSWIYNPSTSLVDPTFTMAMGDDIYAGGFVRSGYDLFISAFNRNGSYLWNISSNDAVQQRVEDLEFYDQYLWASESNGYLTNATLALYLANGTRVRQIDPYTGLTEGIGKLKTLPDGDLFYAYNAPHLNDTISLWYYDVQYSKLEANHTLTLSDFADGRYEFAISSLDFANNLGGYQNYSLWLDSTAGTIPQLLTTDVLTNSNSFAVAWTRSVDATSGISGYYLRVDNNSDFSSPEYEYYQGNVTAASVNMSANGTWYISVRSRNGASLNSSWSDSVSGEIDQIAPTISVLYPPAASTVASTTVSLRLWTNENARCSFIYGIKRYVFSYTGAQYHETSVPLGILADGTNPQIFFECYDTIGNLGTASRSFSIDTTLVVDSIVIQTPIADAFVNAPANVSVIVQAGGDAVIGLPLDALSVYIDGQEVVDLGYYEESAGVYNLFFYTPLEKGNFTVRVDAGTDTDSATLEVLPTRFFGRFSGQVPSSAQESEFIALRYNTTMGLGWATDTLEELSMETSGSSLAVGTLSGSTLYLFVTSDDASEYAEKKDRLLGDGEFMNQEQPSFGFPDELDVQTVTMFLQYPKIEFLETYARTRGQYETFITNYGLLEEGPNRGKFNISLRMN